MTHDAAHAEERLLRFVAMVNGDEAIAQDVTAFLRDALADEDDE